MGQPENFNMPGSSPESSKAQDSSMPEKKPAKIELMKVNASNLKDFKRIHQVVFPVVYDERFFKDAMVAGDLAMVACYNNKIVGVVCCTINFSKEGGQLKRRLYIMTLGCIAAYRGLGIGSRMVEHVLNIATKDGKFESVCLHVQVNNNTAIEFYKRFGFKIGSIEKNYYKRIEPADAYVLKKEMEPTKKSSDTDP